MALQAFEVAVLAVPNYTFHQPIIRKWQADIPNHNLLFSWSPCNQGEVHDTHRQIDYEYGNYNSLITTNACFIFKIKIKLLLHLPKVKCM